MTTSVEAGRTTGTQWKAAQAVAAKTDNIFPVFILTQVPAGLAGLIVAGIFAAAISSLTSILASLSQTSLSAVYLPLLGIDPDEALSPARHRELLRVSRALIVFWGIALCVMALLIHGYVEARKAAGEEVLLLDLALGLTSYIVGALLAAFLLAWLPLRVNAWGLIWSAPLSVFTVYASSRHDETTFWLCAAIGAFLVLTWIAAALLSRKGLRLRRLYRTPWLLVGVALMLLVWWRLWFVKVDVQTGAPVMEMTREGLAQVKRYAIGWPWYAPIGGLVAFVFGYALADRRSSETEDHPGNR